MYRDRFVFGFSYSIWHFFTNHTMCECARFFFLSFFHETHFVCMCVKIGILSLASGLIYIWAVVDSGLLLSTPFIRNIKFQFLFIFIFSREWTRNRQIRKTCAHFIWIWFCFLNSVLKCATLKYNKNNEAHEKKRVAAKCFIANRFLIGTASI